MVQDGRLDCVERALESQQGLLHDMEASHARRMDAFQVELVELQKAASSRKAVPSPSSLRPSDLQSGNFDIVIGGWKEGSTREWVERELAKLLTSVGAQEHVSQTILYGKRPGFAKFVLKLEDSWAPPDRRQFQLKVLTRIRSAHWAPGGREVWVTTDKSPKQRRVSKATAQLNAFLRDCLKVDSGVLEVASWAAAKAYVGEFRVTGLTEENEYGAKPACDVADLRWLVRDARLGVTVWLDLGSLSKGLALNKSDLRSKWLAHFGDASE